MRMLCAAVFFDYFLRVWRMTKNVMTQTVKPTSRYCMAAFSFLRFITFRVWPSARA